MRLRAAVHGDPQGWEEYEKTAESDPIDREDLTRLVDVGDLPFVGELAGRWYWNAARGRFQKNRRRSTSLIYDREDRRGHSEYARELRRYA